MRIKSVALVGALTLGLFGCSTEKLNVPNYNSPTVTALAKDPNGVQLLATGILASERGAIIGFDRDLGIFGREVYNYFTTDGRTVSNYLVGLANPQRLDPGGFANGNWSGKFQNMKNPSGRSGGPALHSAISPATSAGTLPAKRYPYVPALKCSDEMNQVL